MSYVATQVPRDIICAVTTYRLAGGSGQESYPSTAYASFSAGITPLSPHRRALMGGSLLLSQLLFCDDTAGIVEGDKVTVTYKGVTTEYRAFHVDTYQYGGHPHKEAVLSRVES